MSINTTQFDMKLRKLADQIKPKAIETGLGRAGLQIMNDAIMQSPTVPKEEGWLRGSASVFVNNELSAVSEHGIKGEANLVYTESRGLEVVVGFNTPYAARLHESPKFNFTEPSSGAKFLETKLTRNKKTYLKIIANALKEGLGHA